MAGKRPTIIKSPSSPERAISDAGDFEFALTFEPPQEEHQGVNVVQKEPSMAKDSHTKFHSLKDFDRRGTDIHNNLVIMNCTQRACNV